MPKTEGSVLIFQSLKKGAMCGQIKQNIDLNRCNYIVICYVQHKKKSKILGF